jgi:hypothetical protein
MQSERTLGIAILAQGIPTGHLIEFTPTDEMEKIIASDDNSEATALRLVDLMLVEAANEVRKRMYRASKKQEAERN